MRRSFWPLIFAALLLAVAATASLIFAYVNRRYESSDFWNRATGAPNGAIEEVLRASARPLEDPLPWLIAGTVLAVMPA